MRWVSVTGAGLVGLLIGNVGRLPGIGVAGGSNTTLLDLALLPLWAALVLGWRLGRRPAPSGPVVRWLVAFIVAATLSLGVAIARWHLDLAASVTAASYLLRWIAYAGWFFFVITDQADPATSADGWRAFDLAVVLFAGFGVGQSIFLPGFAQMVHPSDVLEWDRQGRRLVSTLLDPNFAAGLVVIGLVLRLARRVEGLRLGVGVDLLLLLALVLTLSRSALLALMGAGAVLLMARGLSWRVLRLGLVVALLLLPVLPFVLRFAASFGKVGVDVSGLQRLASWWQGWTMFTTHPWTGVGFNAVGPARQAYGFSRIGTWHSLEGGILTVAAMTGLIGLVTFAGLWISFGRECRRVWQHEGVQPAERAEAVGVWAASVGVLVQSFFVNSLFLPFIMFPLWVFWGRVHRVARRIAPLVVLGLASGATACEPCAGLAGCSPDARMVVRGTILNRDSKKPQGGVEVAIGTASVRTNAQGGWRLEWEGTQDTVVTVTVRASAEDVYAVGVTVRRPRVGGEAEDVGAWFDRPLIRHTFRITFRGQPLGLAETEFRPIGGSRDSVLRAQASEDGYLQFAGTATRPGAILGEFRIRHPVFGDRRFEEVAIYADYQLQYPLVRGWADFDASRPMIYSGEVLDRRIDFRKIGGATVTFRRTSGARIFPEVFSATTESAPPFVGRFTLAFDAEQLGTTVGDLTITTPDRRFTETYRNVSLVVRDTTTSRYLGVFPVAHAWMYSIEAWRLDLFRPDPGIPYVFERVGGPEITPSRWEGVTDGGGRIWLKAAYADTGAVIGRWTLYPPDRPAYTYPLFQLPTFAENEPRFVGTLMYGPAIWYYGFVRDSLDRPVAGAQVSWRRTGGIEVDPTSGSATTDADGRFYISRMSVPLPGELRLEMTVRRSVAAGAPSYTFGDIGLTTHETIDWNLGPILRIPPL